MEFEEAIHQVKQFKIAKRENWDGYLFMPVSPSKLSDHAASDYYEMDYLIMIKLKSDEQYNPDVDISVADDVSAPYEDYVPTPHDIMATDWKVIK